MPWRFPPPSPPVPGTPADGTAAPRRARPGSRRRALPSAPRRRADKGTAGGPGRLGEAATRPAKARPGPARAQRNPLPGAGFPPGTPRSLPSAQTPPGVGVPPPLNFYLHLRALVSPASLRRRPGAEREPEPLPPAGGKRGEGDEHPGAGSPAPRRHRSSPERRR